MIFFYQGRERRNWRPGNQRSSWRIGKCELLTSDVCSVLIYFRLHKITVRSPNISTVRDVDRENYFVTHTESRRLKQFSFIQQLQTNDICIIRVNILVSIRLCRAYVHQPQSARKICPDTCPRIQSVSRTINNHHPTIIYVFWLRRGEKRLQTTQREK